MLSFVNGRTSEHYSTLLFGVIWGVLSAIKVYLIVPGADPISMFLLATAIGMSVAGFLGWLVSKISKDEAHFFIVANWFLIIACFYRVYNILDTI